MAEEMVGAPMGGEEITQDDKLWALLSYIFCPLIGIIVLLIEDKKNRPFLKYNAVVSIILGVVGVLLSWACIGILVWFYAIYLITSTRCGISAKQLEREIGAKIEIQQDAKRKLRESAEDFIIADIRNKILIIVSIPNSSAL